ncbi:hypothetical protein M3J09_013872 [Ascochyta lentis]
MLSDTVIVMGSAASGKNASVFVLADFAITYRGLVFCIQETQDHYTGKVTSQSRAMLSPYDTYNRHHCAFRFHRAQRPQGPWISLKRPQRYCHSI